MRKFAPAGIALGLSLTLGCGSTDSASNNSTGGAPSGAGSSASAGAGAGAGAGGSATSAAGSGSSAGGSRAGSGGSSAGSGGSSAGSGGSSAGGSNSDPGPLTTPLDFCRAWTGAQCARIFECNPEQAAKIGTLEDCKTALAGEFCADGDLCPGGYDAAIAMTCVSAVRTNACGASLPSICYDSCL